MQGMRKVGRGLVTGLAVVALAAGACSSGDEEPAASGNEQEAGDAVVEETSRMPNVEPATLEGPITTGQPSYPADPKPVDLDAIGYEEAEWFASGEAATYTAGGTLGPDGDWTFEPAGTAPFKTRFVVRRPADAEDFSGTVVVEWLNVSAVEASPDWTYTNRAIVDAGAAWVGVSVQAFGIIGGESLIQTGDAQQSQAANGGIKGGNPERYGSLEHPGDTYAFDIYSQVGAALRAQGADVFGAEARHVIAAGESQSAGYLAGYINGVQPLADVFDGFFVHSRGAGAAQADGTRAVRGSTEAYRLRTDLDVPVLVFETETDVGPLLRFATARQPDTDLLRTWEAAGTAHADAYLVGKDFALCPGAINQGPQHYVTTAAMEALLRWVTEGEAPPTAEPIRTSGPDGLTVERDEHGNALGGIRTPTVDVPIATYTGESTPGAPILCALFGGTTPFDAATLSSLYPSADDYLTAFDAALDEAIEAGFVREADREMYAAEAREVTIP